MKIFSNLAIYQIKQAYISLKQQPGFVFSVVSTMGVTLGALLCILTLAYVMLIKPLPYPDQERLYNIEHQLVNHGDVDGSAFTYPNLMHLYKNQTIFEKSALLYFDGAVITSLPSEPMAEVSFVTPQWFEMLATKMAVGRTFTNTEKLNSYNPVALISYEMWQTEYDGDKNILDKKVSFSGISFQIVGVLSKDNVELPIAGPSFRTKIYIPWDFNTVSDRDRKAWGNDDGGLMFVGKLKANLVNNQSAQQRDQILTNLINDNWQVQVSDHNFFKGWSININTEPLKSYIISDGEKSVILLLIGTLGLVVIASTNIANLFISRTAERQKQLAICAAIGASRKQLFSGIFSEACLLMFVSIIIAQLIAYIGFSALHHFLSDYLPRINELTLNYFSVFSSITILLLLTFVFSYVCLKMINYRVLNSTLQSSGKGNGVQVSKSMRNILIISQITVATVLIFINIVLYKDAIKLVEQKLGYETNGIYSAVLALPNIERSLQAEPISELKKALLELPKISGISQSMRPSGFGTFALTTEADNKRFSISGKDVDNHYFSLINQKIIEGDSFSDADIKDRELVTIINDVFAKKLAPNGSAIGIRFNNGSRVIGVVKAINIPGRVTVTPRFYYPASLTRNMLLIKLHDGQSLSREELIPILKTVNKNFSLFSFSSLTEYKNRRLFSAITTAITTITLTIITFLLSGLGLYGILKYSSQMRRFEIGTHLAIGAKRKDIIQMIIKDNSTALVIGVLLSTLILLGLYIGFSDELSSYISSQLIPLFIITLGLISLVSFLACYLPLRQYINNPAIHSLRGSE
ncbi:MAG: ABC transporter permease [Colwelliaceae bacterium]|nr:ABC transporter permease [Colwelliaceae bacterium]